jgi:integrase
MKISKRFVDQAAATEKDAFYYDDGLTGFGVKITKGGKKNFIVQTRIKGKVARFTIGEYGRPWSVDQAREAAIQILADVVKGVDPRVSARANKDKATVKSLVEDYLERGALQKKATTLQFEAGLTKRHILPLLGDAKVADLTKADIQKFQRSVMVGKTAIDVKTGPRGRAIVTGGKGAANRSLALLSSILTFAVNEGHRTDNPAKGIKHFKLAKHDRYLSNDELKRLGKALDDAELAGASVYVVAAIRFMLLTGCRRNEALTLQWAWIDIDHSLAKLPDSKTGKKVLLLGVAALSLLTKLPRLEGSPLVFPSSAGGTTPISIQKSWDKIRKAAKLQDIRLHDLRHNFASSAVSAGQSLYIVGKLLGHTQSQTTQRYAHLAADPLHQAADEISKALDKSIKPRT